jgi:hypothetical protein
MKSSEDVFRKNWGSIFIAAIRHRSQRPPDSEDNLTVTKTAFDDLVSVVDVASRIQQSFHPSTEMTINYQNGEYHVAVRSAVFRDFSVSKPTLLESIWEAQKQVNAEIDKFIR